MAGGGGRGKARRKHGKERLDRYYHLAKEQGYRARSAFKLIQLAQRFSLFQRPRLPGGAAASSDAAIVDLCAAPGGWLQVCAKHAPVATRIVGIDLVPIKGIRGVETLTEDITRPSLPAKIKKLLQGADVWLVLHDGSPNMGTDWSIDAFNQNVLVLSALRTAALLLCEGGTFVSKVFRSQDYAALLFVLQTLFTRVHATKPLASRNVSAEIFVVCQGYKKPAVLDPRLFDPKSVFLTDVADAGAAPLVPKEAGAAAAAAQKRRRQQQEQQDQQQQTRLPEKEEEEEEPGECRGGEEDAAEGASAAEKHGEGHWLSSLELDGGSIFGKGKKGLFAELVRQQARRPRHGDQMNELRRVTVQEFFDAEEPASLLVLQAREVVFQEPTTPLEEVVKTHALTTEEILRCLGDVQVLGKSELVAVLKWRFRVKKALLLQRRAALLEQGSQTLQQGGQAKGGPQQQQQGEKRGGPGSAPRLEHDSALAEASTDEGSRSEADSHEKDDIEGELQRLGALVQRREEKRKKRVESKEKQKDLRLRLSRGGCLDAGESVGHHRDPDLFSLSSKTAALLEEAGACLPAEDDLFECDDEKGRKQQKGESSAWRECEDTSEADEEEGSEEEANVSEGDAGEGSSDEMDPVDCMEAELALGYRLQKLQQAQAAAGTKEKKHTRRQRVRSEWAAELENFRDFMQAEAAAVLAQKARQGVESDESEEEELGSEGEGRTTDRTKGAKTSTERPSRELLDDDDDSGVSECSTEPVNWTREDKSVGSRRTQSSCEGVEGSRSRRMRVISAGGDRGAGGGRVETERTTRWFRQPIFDECEDEILPAAFDGLQDAAGELTGGADELVCGKSLTRSRGETNLVRPPKKRRRAEGVIDSDVSSEAETDGEFTAVSDEAGERNRVSVAAEDGRARDEGESVIAELQENLLPYIPVCEKKVKQQRRRERARRQQEKASKGGKLKDTDSIADDAPQELSTARPCRGSKGERLEEVPPFEVVGSGTLKPPADPEELARIQAVGPLLINRTSRMDLIDGAYNRYAFNDEELPEWFVEEEKKHNKPQLPLTKELMRQYRQKLLDISRRPIRKVQEARARKRLREKRQLQKVKSQAVAIAESAEFTDAGKARAIEKIARKASRVKGKSEKNYYVVSRGVRGGGTLVSKKNAGNKCAKTKFVDRRMKKDKRALKNAANRKGKSTKKYGKRRLRKTREKAEARAGRAKN